MKSRVSRRVRDWARDLGGGSHPIVFIPLMATLNRQTAIFLFPDIGFGFGQQRLAVRRPSNVQSIVGHI